MALSSKQVLDYLNDHLIRNHNGDFGSLLEMLHYIYTTGNPVDNDTTRSLFQDTEVILKDLSADQADAIFWTISRLCTEYERRAFSHGILVGMHLMTELTVLP